MFLQSEAGARADRRGGERVCALDHRHAGETVMYPLSQTQQGKHFPTARELGGKPTH